MRRWSSIVLAFGCSRAGETPPPKVPSAVVVESVRVPVEVARTPEERAAGLMHRRRLAPEAGMLFIFEHSTDQVFWMKNTHIPLDMIFVSEDLRVVGVLQGVAPMTETPRSIGVPSRYVLEVNAGFAADHGIRVGARVKLEGID